MSKSALVVLLLVLLLAGGAIFVFVFPGRTVAPPLPAGGGPGSPAPGAHDSAGPAPGGAAVPPPEPLFKGWEAPALAIVLSGEQHGHFEPCGCSLKQLGGMSRRDDLIRQITERGWPVTAFDAGGLTKLKFKGRRQTRFKFETMFDALKAMNYGGLAIGPEELGAGPEYLLSQQRPDYPPMLAANVILFDTPDVGTPQNHRVFTVGKLKIGVTAIFGSSLKSEVLPPGKDQNESGDLKILDPADALPAAIDALKAKQPDLLILLSHAKLKESKKLAAAFPDFDLILSTDGPEDPANEPVLAGKPLLVTVGAKGKHVGVVGVYPDNPKQRLRFTLVDLDDQRFRNSPRMESLMKFYQDRLQNEQVAATDLAVQSPNGAEFVGAAKCGECHTRAYAKWKESKHAKAFEHLKSGRKGHEASWISRIYDPECLACHVTGWDPKNVVRYETGYVDEATSALLLGQQCENCHGAGSRHVEEELKWKKAGGKLSDELLKWRKSQHMDLEQAKAVERGCYKCHDGDNSPGFNFEKYWNEIKHPGRD